jgi:uncharacterized protein (TIGR03435 family)
MIGICVSIAFAGLLAQAQSFEVASIKPNPPATNVIVFKNPDVNPIRISGNRVSLQRIGLKGLVVAAYNVKDYQVSGGPGWASGIDSLYDITAKTQGDAAPSLDQIRLMLQSLLAERFQLKLRRESKQLPVYNLVVANGGLKLKEVPPDAPPPAANMRRGSMPEIAGLMGLFLDRPLIDRTGLAGTYEYSMDLADTDRNAGPDAPGVAAAAITAIQDQLGLKAEPAKAMLDILVIESAEKPSQN